MAPTTTRLFTNHPSPTWSYVDRAAITVGSVFTPLLSGYVTSFWWYATDGDTGNKPTNLKLWDVATRTLIASSTAITHPGSAQWVEIDLGTSYLLTAGRQYVISAYQGANTHYGETLISGFPGTAYPLGVSTPSVVWSADGVDGYPGSGSSATSLEGLDVTFSYDPDSQPEQIAPVLQEALDDWFGTTPSAPEGNVGGWLGDRLDDLESGILASILEDTGDLGTDLANLAVVLAGVATKTNSIWDLAGAFTEVQYSAIRTAWLALEDRLTGPDARGGSAFYGVGGTHVGNGVEQLLTENDPGRLLTRPPATGWTEVDTETWEGEIAWAVPADLYVINVTGWPAHLPTVQIAGLNWRPRAGWWAELHGNQVGERHYFDFEYGVAHILPSRMQGILIGTTAALSGTVQAWRWDG